MRRLAGAWVVMAVIAAWNLAGNRFTRPSAPVDAGPFVFAGAETTSVSPAPATVPTRESTLPPGKIVIASFHREPLAFLSTAPADSLDLLPGVGPVLAARIIEARAARGPFTSWNDVLAVRGIGPRTIARWQSPSVRP